MSNFLTAFSGEEVEHLRMTNFNRHIWFSSAKITSKSWQKCTRVGFNSQEIYSWVEQLRVTILTKFHIALYTILLRSFWTIKARPRVQNWKLLNLYLREYLPYSNYTSSTTNFFLNLNNLKKLLEQFFNFLFSSNTFL